MTSARKSSAPSFGPAYSQSSPDDVSFRLDSRQAPFASPSLVNSRTSPQLRTSPHLPRSVSSHSQSWNPTESPQQTALSSRQGSLPYSHSPALPQTSISPHGPAPRSSTQRGFGGYQSVGSASRIWILEDLILEDFRRSPSRYELMNLVGHIVELSRDHLSSKIIVTKLETASSDEKKLVFDEILPEMLPLPTDMFAGYVIQKLFERGSEAQTTAMAKVLESHVLPLSLHACGSRVVEKARYFSLVPVVLVTNAFVFKPLEYVLADQQVHLIKELDGHVLKCIYNVAASHVVKRALERIPSENLIFITNACIGQVYALATHHYGSRVLQRIFENCPSSQTRILLDELHSSVHIIFRHWCTNYVAQAVLDKGPPADKSRIIGKVHGQVLSMARHKFASNVLEKYIVPADDNERHWLSNEVLRLEPDGPSEVRAMLVDPSANYVLQKMLGNARGEQRRVLFEETSIEFSSLKMRHMVTIEKLLTEYVATER